MVQKKQVRIYCSRHSAQQGFGYHNEGHMITIIKFND